MVASPGARLFAGTVCLLSAMQSGNSEIRWEDTKRQEFSLKGCKTDRLEGVEINFPEGGWECGLRCIALLDYVESFRTATPTTYIT